ncbi:MAG: DNA polymerase III subunit delta' [Deltaproteobacteria bacterium]|nr:DNA polymerase III subunit delta' [Deltaproteobacteria bacterium]
MSFKDILGHKKEIDVLRSAAKSGRVAHSFLFSGPPGIGKRLVAIEFAKALNCADGEDGDSCGVCHSCATIAGETHQNLTPVWPTIKEKEVLIKDPSGLIRIEQVRDVLNVLRYRVEEGRKVVIVDSAEKFMPAAANAFLKTLEEPPAGSVIILVSSRAADLLPTIISRCQRVNFRPLPEETVSAFLSERAKIPAEEARAIVRINGGNIANSIRYIDEGLNGTRKEMLSRLSSIKPDCPEDALKFAEELAKRDDLEDVLEFMKSWYRDRLLKLEGAENLIVNVDINGYIEQGSHPRRLLDNYSYVEEARRSIMPPRYGNKQLTMESLLLRLTA